MAFDYPPNILGGISRPDVIQTQGAGGALAGGLDTVLAAILQHAQLQQQAQMQQATLAQKAAETTEAQQRGTYYGAEAQKALRPTPPTPREGHVQVQPDGSVVLIDTITGKTTPVPGARGIPTVHNLDPNSPAGIAGRIKEYRGTTLVAERERAAREEADKRQARIAQGQAILGSVSKGGPNDPVLDAFGQAFRSVRAGNKKMHPGEAAFFAWEQLQKLRPDLIPPKPRVPNALDELLSGGSESPGASPSAAPASLPPLSADEQQTARTDPGFAKWLQTTKGYSPSAWKP